MSNSYECNICHITCTGAAPYQQHLQSAKHLKKAQLSDLKQCDSPNVNVPSSPQHIQTNDRPSENDSMSNKLCTISAETMRILLEWDNRTQLKPFCEICQLPLHGANNAELHFASDNSAHARKFSTWKRIQEGDAEHACLVCAEIFPNESTLYQHYSTDNHKELLTQKNRLKKFIKIFDTYSRFKEHRQKIQELKTSNDDDNFTNEFRNLKVTDSTSVTKDSRNNSDFTMTKLNKAMETSGDSNDDQDNKNDW